MNIGRKVIFAVVTIVVIIINVEAFVLSTFFDMTKEKPFEKWLFYFKYFHHYKFYYHKL